MSIFGDLANATKALNAHRYGVTTAGANIANVNNPDYSRQRVELGERGVVDTLAGPRGLGVEVLGFQQMRDQVLDREILREASVNASLEAELSALSKAQASTGQNIDRSGDSPFIDGVANDGSGSGGMAEMLSDFFNSFHALSANPSSDAEKEALLQRASLLAEKFNVTANRFDELQSDLTAEVGTDLVEVNRLLGEIARLNAQVARSEAHNAGQALTLRDERQARLQKLSEYMQVNVETIADSNGQVRVFLSTASGEPSSVDLVDRGRFEQLELDDSLPGVPRFSVSTTSTQVTVRGGKIHGLLEAREGGLQSYADSLDELASAVVDRVNSVYNSGTGPGNTNFFKDTGLALEKSAAGISLDGSLSAATLRVTNDPAQEAGDNSLALAIAEIGAKEVAALGDRTLGGFYRATVSELGEAVSAVNSSLEDESIVFELLKEQQDAVSGVSIDEEMTDMMKFQRAYEATGRLVRAIDEMLDVIINRLF